MAYADMKDSQCFTLPKSFKMFKNSHKVSEEIENVTSSYPKAKIISKDQAVEILVLPYNSLNVYLRLHLLPEFPELLPEISVTSDCLTKTETQRLNQLLTTKAKASTGQPMLLGLVNEARQYLSRTKLTSTAILTDAKPSTKHKAKLKSKDVAIDVSNQDCKVKRKNKEDVLISNSTDNAIAMDVSQLSTISNTNVTHTKRPSHFIALRINDETILKNLTKIQNELVQKEPLLTKGLFAKEIFHLTLCSLGLDTDDDVVKCIDALEQAKSELLDCLPVNSFKVQGMSQFYNRAIYAKVKHEDDFTKFLKILRDGLENSGVEIRDEHDGFTPHVTIIKVKRPERKLFGSRNIEPSIYSYVRDTVFGEQSVDSLFLCCMDGQRRPDGFYVTLHEIKFR